MALQLTAFSHEAVRDVRRLYRAAFPKEEQAPFRKLYTAAARGEGEFLICRDGEEFVGFTFSLFPKEGFVFLFYFAVEEGARSKGYGSGILSAYCERYAGRPVVLEAERVEPSENYEQRVRRRAFYCRNGFAPTGVVTQVCGVNYEAYCRGGQFDEKGYAAFAARRIAEYRN